MRNDEIKPGQIIAVSRAGSTRRVGIRVETVEAVGGNGTHYVWGERANLRTRAAAGKLSMLVYTSSIVELIEDAS